MTIKTQPHPMAFRSIFFLRAPVLAIAYLAGYVLLDWISYIEPFGSFGITPWNPPTGLSFVLVLLFGQRFFPLLFAAPFLANVLVRGFPLPLPVEIAGDCIIGGGYAIGLMVLLRPQTRFNPALVSQRDIIVLIGIGAASSGVVALCYVSLLTLTGFVLGSDFASAAIRFWIGDVIGIAVMAPFALILLTRGRRFEASYQTATQVIAVFISLVVVEFFAERRVFEFFYVLFLPVIWMAITGGLELVTFGLLLTQIGLIVSIHLLDLGGIDITSFQALMLVLALTGLAAGAVVTEHRRSEAQLRRHQESLAHVSRLGSMGELAAMVAHEINQPLMAAGTYTRLVSEGLNDVKVPAAVIETARKAAAQVQRAADVVRQLRALIRLDVSNRAPVSVERIVRETVALYLPELERHNIAVNVQLDPGLQQVMVDALQVEQALLNVLKNSVEAITDNGGTAGDITIRAHSQDERVTIDIQDNGPGFPPEVIEGQSTPFPSGKAQGLGIGLSLCRSIIEAHGGEMEMLNRGGGANVQFKLPIVTQG
jgi:signal transduction histidine kinase